MAHLLADETLKDVLCRVLDVPDTDFASVAPTSPFALRQFSNSDVLLVCKRWMRVATPLLYHTVVLRSVAQAQSLARALKKNPEFGPFLKKLRIEGAFGASVGKIMLAGSAFISDLVLSFALASGDNVTSMCAALASLRPRRLILIGTPGFGRLATRNLSDSLMKVLPCWTTLTCIVFPGRYLRISPWTRDVLASTQNLQEVVVDGGLASGGAHKARSALVKILSSLPSVKTIRVNAESLVAGLDVPGQIIAFGDIYAKMVFPDPVVGDITPESFPYGRQISIHSAPLPVQRGIWKRILQHVVFNAPTWPARRGTSAFIGIPSENQDLTSVPGAHRLMRVCQMFKDIVVELAVHAVALTTPGRWNTFASLIDARPALALSTRGLFLASPSVNETFERSILMRLSNVRRVAIDSMRMIDADKFHINSLLLLAETAWSSLEQLEIRSLDNAPISSPLRFSKLIRLQVGGFDYRLGTPVWDLPALEELDLDHAGGSILRSMIYAELPRLRFFTVQGDQDWSHGRLVDKNGDTVYPFLRKHGSKLLEVRMQSCRPDLVLSSCPNIRVYRLSDAQLYEPPFDKVKTPQTSLISMELPCYLNYVRNRQGNIHNTAWEALFNSLAIGRGDGATPSADCLFPSLVDITISSWTWPTTPQEIQQSKMVKWAEGIHSKGIKVLAQDKTPWRPRLKHGR
ncbi:hypothetical protein EXIGLDRAFT_834860 [Exidia glandulosa HHB12029]|uniref:Uncharacterized protein n=1 Tax=Exidia glandulosa HHB12029 TaxID=1314781 RepID=A0A166AS59_EXIGL|nr:hypothetical protein EXIGLDRAFT_834860 [Exidia glandulosa HHB12029]